MLARIHNEMVESIKHLDECTQGKIILAYVNYQLYDVEPDNQDILVYTIFKAKQFDLDAIKNDMRASRENGKKGGRPLKNFDNSTKPKHNLKKPNNNLTKPNDNLTKPEKEKEKEREKEKENDNKLLLRNNSGADFGGEEVEKEFGNPEINSLISSMKHLCSDMGVAYDSTKERLFAKQLLSARIYGDFCEKIGQSRQDFALNIMKVSLMINYWRGVCSGPMKVYHYYAEVYNEAILRKNKNVVSVLDDL